MFSQRANSKAEVDLRLCLLRLNNNLRSIRDCHCRSYLAIQKANDVNVCCALNRLYILGEAELNPLISIFNVK